QTHAHKHTITYALYTWILCFDASSWTADVPKSVSGLRGSCIVIPCSFNYPEPEKKPSKFTGIWFKGTHDTIYHPDSSNIIKDYRGRTELVGDLRQKNCSLRIDPLHDNHNKRNSNVVLLYPIIYPNDNPPSLSVREEVKVGEVVSASCSVSHSCPSDSPLLTWSHSGTHSVQSQQLTNVQWEVTSSLTFSPSSTDHNQSLVCTAAYRGGKTVKSLKTLNDLNNVDGMGTLIRALDSVFLKEVKDRAYEAYSNFDSVTRDISVAMTDYIIDFEQR
uniref:Ig-like domain-containing protein n=1 Tax=Oncorhynchus kisutch TaxID=8019 RepID=A0A8C7CR58_ONCKI